MNKEDGVVVSLAEFMENWEERNLEEIVEMVESILDSLEVLHEQKFLYLVLCPETVGIYGKRIILTEHTSMWSMQTEERYIKLKMSDGMEEFSAPEVRLKNFKQLNYSSDLYSVCALFYYLLTKELPKDRMIHLHSKNYKMMYELQILERFSENERKKIINILRKGLHISPYVRYQTTVQLRNDLHGLWFHRPCNLKEM